MVELATLQAVSYTAAALGVCFAAVYYVMVLRHQKKTRQAQMFMNIYDKMMSKDFMSDWDKVVMSPWSTWDEWKGMYDGDDEFHEAELSTQGFYEGVGVLVREGLLPIRMVALLMCGMTRRYWERHMVMIEEGRRWTGHRRWYSEAEYLYDELVRYLGEHPELDTRVEQPL